jgi:predicted GNAT family N-acyltransferase
MTTDDSRAEITVVPVRNEGDLFQALAIREVVFIEEQHVPEGIERDAEDQKAFHVLAMQGGHAIGTGRLVILPQPPQGETGRWAQVGRMAVLQSHRKAGIGSRLLTALEDEARRREVSGIILHAQLYALEFYRKYGYQPVGAVFEEAGMPHLQMHKKM